MLENHPERHVWGLGRHHAGSNFFWYLKDPAGNFSEYYSDMDCIPEDQLWTPEDLEGARSLFAWGPPPPPSFLHPDDLAAMMTGAHAPRLRARRTRAGLHGAEVRPSGRSCVGWFRMHRSFCRSAVSANRVARPRAASLRLLPLLRRPASALARWSAESIG